MPEELLSPAEAVEYIAQKWGQRRHVSTLRRWVRLGHVAAELTSAGYRIPVSELERIHQIVDPEAERISRNG